MTADGILPERVWHRARQVLRLGVDVKTKDRVGEVPPGLHTNPWDGARVAPLQRPILRPGQWPLYRATEQIWFDSNEDHSND